MYFFSPLPHPSATKFTAYTLVTRNQQPVLQSQHFATHPKTYPLYENYRAFILARFPKSYIASGVLHESAALDVFDNTALPASKRGKMLSEKQNYWLDSEESGEESPAPSLFWRPNGGAPFASLQHPVPPKDSLILLHPPLPSAGSEVIPSPTIASELLHEQSIQNRVPKDVEHGSVHINHSDSVIDSPANSFPHDHDPVVPEMSTQPGRPTLRGPPLSYAKPQERETLSSTTREVFYTVKPATKTAGQPSETSSASPDSERDGMSPAMLSQTTFGKVHRAAQENLLDARNDASNRSQNTSHSGDELGIGANTRPFPALAVTTGKGGQSKYRTLVHVKDVSALLPVSESLAQMYTYVCVPLPILFLALSSFRF